MSDDDHAAIRHDTDADPVEILERAVEQLDPEERARAREALEELRGRADAFESTLEIAGHPGSEGPT